MGFSVGTWPCAISYTLSLHYALPISVSQGAFWRAFQRSSSALGRVLLPLPRQAAPGRTHRRTRCALPSGIVSSYYMGLSLCAWWVAKRGEIAAKGGFATHSWTHARAIQMQVCGPHTFAWASLWAHGLAPSATLFPYTTLFRSPCRREHFGGHFSALALLWAEYCSRCPGKPPRAGLTGGPGAPCHPASFRVITWG